MMCHNQSSILIAVGAATLAFASVSLASSVAAIWALAGTDLTAPARVAEVWSVGLTLAVLPPAAIFPLFAAASAARLRKLSQDRDELASAAYRDGLTGLLNRRGFDEAAARALASGRPGPYVAIMCDIDKFKSINDGYGHSFGDRALCHVAAILDETLCGRPALLGRIGGEEFAILLQGIEFADAMALAQSLRAACERTKLRREGAEISVTISLGLAQAPDGEAKLPGLMQRADAALYRAKGLGRNQVASAEAA